MGEVPSPTIEPRNNRLLKPLSREEVLRIRKQNSGEIPLPPASVITTNGAVHKSYRNGTSVLQVHPESAPKAAPNEISTPSLLNGNHPTKALVTSPVPRVSGSKKEETYKESDGDDDGLVIDLREDQYRFLGDDEDTSLKFPDILDVVKPKSAIKTPAEDYTSDDNVRMYLNEIGRVPLLTAEQEVIYSRTYLRLRDWPASILDEMSDSLLSTTESQRQVIFKDFQRKISPEEKNEARNRLIEPNLRLVVSIAKKYLGRGMGLLDLIQEGNLGLGRSVEKYDPEMGFKFSTYATWWVKQSISRAVADKARTIRVPVHMIEAIGQVARASRVLQQDLGREPKLEEISYFLKHDKLEKELGRPPTGDEIQLDNSFSLEKVQEIIQSARQPISLQTPVGEEEDTSLEAFIPDKADEIGENIEDVANKEYLSQLFPILSDREQCILRLRFGLGDGRERTLEEVGSEMGVTRERIRQIEAKALKRLQS